MNCVHELGENDQCSGAILKKCAVCKRRCLYSKKVFRCKACKGYVHKRCLPFAKAVADFMKTIGVEETSPTTTAVENDITKSNLPSEESADDPAATVDCDPEASAASLPAPVRKNKKKKHAKKSTSKNNLPPPTVASEIPPLDNNVPAAGEAPSLPDPVRKTTKKRGKKNASTSDVQPSLVANVVSDAIPSKVGGLAGPKVRMDPKPAAVVPSCGDALPPSTLSTAAAKKAVKKKAAAAVVGTKNVPVVAMPSKVGEPAATIVRVDPKPAAGIPCLDAVSPPPVANALPVVSVADETASAPARTADVAIVVPSLTVAEKKAAKRRAKVPRKKAAARSRVPQTPAAHFGEVSELPVADETASAPAASGVPAISSEVTGPATTIVRVDPKPAAGIPCLDAVPPPPVANALPVVSVADETASAPARTADVAVVVPSLTVAEKKAAKRRAKVARKKAAARSRVPQTPAAHFGEVSELPVADETASAPAASGVPAISSEVTGPAATIVRIDPKPAAGIIPPCVGALPPALSTAAAKKAVKKNAAAVVVAIPSKVTGPAATIVRVDPTPATVIPCVDVPSIPAAVGKTEKESASKVPPPPVANALPAASGVDEPARTADVPSLTVAQKKAAKRRAKVASKKAAARSLVPPAAPAADFGEVSDRLMASANPWMTELKESPVTGASNHVAFVEKIASEEAIANIRYNLVSQGLADKGTLVRLDVCPDQIYLGSGDTIVEAQESAAFAFLVDIHLRMNN